MHFRKFSQREPGLERTWDSFNLLQFEPEIGQNEQKASTALFKKGKPCVSSSATPAAVRES